MLCCVTLAASLLQCVKRQYGSLHMDAYGCTWHTIFPRGSKEEPHVALVHGRERGEGNVSNQLILVFYFPWARVYQSGINTLVVILKATFHSPQCSVAFKSKNGRIIWLQHGTDQKKRRQWRESEKAHRFVFHAVHPCVEYMYSRPQVMVAFWMYALLSGTELLIRGASCLV